MIADSGYALISYHGIEISSSLSNSNVDGASRGPLLIAIFFVTD